MQSFKEYKLYAPWEKAFNRLATPFERFLHQQTTTGLVLMFMTVVALILANTPLAEAYSHLFHTHIVVGIGDFKIDHSLHHWINDGLMALFFFVIGLEIKREVLVGELSDIRNAILPIIAALGGVIMPAMLYFGINQGLPSENGWGIPMATDIAFAISALVLLGRRVPTALVTFLVALAIVDDLMAVVVIALFYTEQIHFIPLFVALGFFLVLILFNRFGIHKPLPYFIIGGLMWVAMLESGVHATIAGILTAMAIPAKPSFNPEAFDSQIKTLTEKFRSYNVQNDFQLHEKQEPILHEINHTVHAVQAPLNRLEHDFHLPVSLIVIPLFALANAGITIDFSAMESMIMEPVTLGVIIGLVAGKVIGIAGVSMLAIKLGIARLPTGSSYSQLLGVSFLGGIGFTMSIFIAGLAWPANEAFLLQAKVGILLASLFAGLFGFMWLRFVAKPIHLKDI
ncbi:Na+/H+ antiporter NhaA [Hydrogenovibrio kuenenii]|uniref:Na+/H+ antiporter NhaA n=1 Tax=Hydrogenovibrio kuenenii TaxID=63658 RepID=UPI000464E566|nr:Na+/H+ antiporter NhaA [Hydrogenovibrio kuenenii]